VGFTDAGCRPAATWLDGLAAPFAESLPPTLVTGTYRATWPAGSAWQAALAVTAYPDPAEARRTTPVVRAYGRLLGRAYAADLPTGRSCASDRDAALAVGGFPEHLQTGEDITFGRSLVAAGGDAVLSLPAEVDWDQRPTLRSNLRMFASYGHGDALTGSPLFIGRNVARGLAYPAGVLLLTRRGVPRRLALVGAAAYLSLPLQRAARRAPAALPLVPVMAAARDLAKLSGCLRGLRERAAG
jgi:hypothetical protein